MASVKSVKVISALKPLNESAQIGDAVKLDGLKGFVIGQIEGQYIVQIQGSTKLVDPEKVKSTKEAKKPEVAPHMKFDEKTQKLLFEQYVRCGVFYGNVPVKTNDCYVRYDQWEKANSEQQIKVIIEGVSTFMPKSQIRIFEDINDFASEENYVPGVIIDEATEQVIENILVNAVDYTNAIGDADAVRVIKVLPTGEQELQTMPKSALRTLAV